MISDCVALRVTEARLLHVKLTGTNMRHRKMHNMPKQCRHGIFKITRIKSESWNRDSQPAFPCSFSHMTTLPAVAREYRCERLRKGHAIVKGRVYFATALASLFAEHQVCRCALKKSKHFEMI